ncbi:MAG: hypothetical protein ABL952_18310, partial [Pyrinomonadaceae bacterium]
IYKEVNSNIERESEQFEPTDPVCRAEKIFGYGQAWTLRLSESTATSGSGSCENVRFKFTNGHSTDVRIENVQYFMGGRWRTETISSNGGVISDAASERRASCGPGETCQTVDVQTVFDDPNRNRPSNMFDLGGAVVAATNNSGVTNAGSGSNLGDADGADITQIKFGYKNRETQNLYGVNQRWSAMKNSQIFRPTSPRCSDGRVYGEGQGWTLGGAGGQNTNNGTQATPTLTQGTNPAEAQGAGLRNAGTIPAATTNGGRRGNGQQTGTDPTGGGNDSASPNGGGRRKKGTKNSNDPNVDVVENPTNKPAQKKRKGQKEKGTATPPAEAKPASNTEPAESTVEPKAKRRKKP